MINGLLIGLSALTGVWLGWYALPICILILLTIRLLERNRSGWIFITCFIFTCFGIWRSVEPPTVTNNSQLEVSTGGIGRIVSFPVPSGDGHRAVLDVTDTCINAQCVPANGRVLVYIPAQQTALSRGQTLRVDWAFSSLQQLPTGYRSFVISQGAEGSARSNSVHLIERGSSIFQWLAISNQLVSERLESLLPDDTGALATGIVTGDDSSLSPQTRDDFRLTNTSHLTAVSGQNVSIIIGFISLWYTPRSSSGRIALHLILIMAVWSFTLFVGLQPPALRAAMVATLLVLGRHVGRRPDPLTIVALTLGVIALLQPLSVYSVGFWLSAAATMALTLALPRELNHRTGRALAEILIAPAVASLVTMPIVLVSFGTWSPVGIIANILLAPVMTIAFPITYLFALIAVPFPGVAGVLTWIPGIPLDFSLVIVKWMAPIAGQIRVDVLSPIALMLIWTPIIIGLWLMSAEADRWIRRVLTTAASWK